MKAEQKILFFIESLNGLWFDSPNDISSLEANEFLRFLKWHRISLGMIGKTITEQIDSSAIEGAIKVEKIYNLKLQSELLKIYQQFSSLGISVIALKGIALSQMLYQNPSLRSSRDIDFLIHKQDVLQALTLLINQGYTLTYPTNIKHEKLLKRYYHVELKNTEGTTIELHWQLSYFPEYLSTIEHFFQNTIHVVVSGKEIKTLNKNDALLYMIYHGSHHAWFRLFWLYDVHTALKNWNLNWNDFFIELKRVGLEKCFIQACLLIKNVFAQTLPETIEQYLASKKISNYLLDYPMNKIFDHSYSTHLTLFGKLRKLRYEIGMNKPSDILMILKIKILHLKYIFSV